ncbi:MAG TPA: recombinase family protein [Dielma fastidiosa]|nr:recombinase family protein [Dielma fastidiosa]
MKTAIYVRVSTDEQQKMGISVPTQIEALKAFAIKNNLEIFDFYIDDGYSGKTLNRPALKRLLEDVENDKVEYIIFTALDRWSRRVGNYYKVQELLDAHKVKWNAILEAYDTETALGTLNLNIKLSITENEQRMASERVKFVFESKRKRGEPTTGSIPYGYKTVNKKLVIDEEKAQHIRDLFNKYEELGNLFETNIYFRQHGYPTYNLQICSRRLHITEYKGVYDKKGVYLENYCPAIISTEQFDRVQNLLKKNGKKSRGKNSFIYIFSKMLYCPLCGKKMSGCKSTKHLKSGDKLYIHYSCYGRTALHECSYRKCPSEENIEKYLIEHIGSELEKYEKQVKIKTKKQIPIDTSKKDSILKKLNKLKDLYLNDSILLDQYNEEFKKLTGELAKYNEIENEVKAKKIDVSSIKKILNTDFVNLYSSLSRLEKQRLWRSIIDKIIVNEDGTFRIFFLD